MKQMYEHKGQSSRLKVMMQEYVLYTYSMQQLGYAIWKAAPKTKSKNQAI